MKKIVILGCENSHANTFLELIKQETKYKEIDVVGVYSEEREAAEKLSKEYGVKVMERYDQAVGEVDGIMVTARHGDRHYEYAKPYIKEGISMFIDKPFTKSEEDAERFIKELKEKKVKISGGSSLRHAEAIKKYKER